MKVIVIANQKGGIGKTTTATALASILAEKGFKSLLIDADQQGNSTDTYKAQVEGAATLYDVLLEENRISLKAAIQKTENGNIVASDPLLRKADEVLNNDVEGLYRLQDALEELEGYDYVIVDYLYCDDEYVEGYELTQEQIEHIVKEYEEDEENEEEDEE